MIKLNEFTKVFIEAIENSKYGLEQIEVHRKEAIKSSSNIFWKKVYHNFSERHISRELFLDRIRVSLPALGHLAEMPENFKFDNIELEKLADYYLPIKKQLLEKQHPQPEGKEVKQNMEKKVKKQLAEGNDIGKPDALVVRSQSSVVVKQDKGGAMSFEIKVYADNVSEASQIAISEAEKLKKELGING